MNNPESVESLISDFEISLKAWSDAVDDLSLHVESAHQGTGTASSRHTCGVKLGTKVLCDTELNLLKQQLEERGVSLV